MCKAVLSISLDTSPNSTDSGLSRLSKLKLLKKVYKDLCLHSGTPGVGISPMELQKTLELEGILGEQAFAAMDMDNDGLITCKEFTKCILALCEGREEEKFSVIFDVMDFNKKGFVSYEDLKAIATALPTKCVKCGQQISRSWHLETILMDLFRENNAYSYAALSEMRTFHEEIFTDISDAIVGSIPPVIFDILGVKAKRICSESCSPALSFHPELGSNPLVYEGRTYQFTLRSECLWGYTSLTAVLPEVLILTKGLFLSTSGDTAFELSNCAVRYHLKASCQAVRDQWMEWITAEKQDRWFDDYYEISEQLGVGGQGVVFQAASKGSGQLAAVKIVSKEGLTVKNEGRIRKEISVLRLSDHPNLLQIYDVFETSERFYLVTELVSGGTLFSWLEERQFPSCESFAKSIITDLATGLLYLHTHGIIHRDVKLENIMLRQGKAGHLEAVLIDFGLACFVGPEKYSTEPVGTLKYAAPELLSRLPYGQKVDCWSLGVILYIMLGGKMPFYGKNDQDIAMKILKKRASMSGPKWASASPEAKALVSGLLTRNVETRMGIEEVLSSEWLTGEPEEVDSPGSEGVPQVPLREETMEAGMVC